VVDCGTAVNPNSVRQQIESAVIDGLSAALYGKVNIEAGKIVESNFHQYRLLRMSEAPQVTVHILPSTDNPGGIGEPGLPPLAPALLNAYARATNRRVRNLPLRA
jgi:isoquinoline 1-oxidoreductase beta subunit